MRVIAGKFRSRTLKALPGLETRPTYDRLKETLFNVLAAQAMLEGAVFLDLFAGTGSIGIEALSRGAGEVYFVECSRKAARVIRENLSALAMRRDARLWRSLRPKRCVNLRREGCAAASAFLILLTKWKAPTRKFCAYWRIRSCLPRADVIAEHDKHFDPGEGAGKLKRYRRLRQGESSFSFYAVERH